MSNETKLNLKNIHEQARICMNASWNWTNENSYELTSEKSVKVN